MFLVISICFTDFLVARYSSWFAVFVSTLDSNVLMSLTFDLLFVKLVHLATI